MVFVRGFGLYVWKTLFSLGSENKMSGFAIAGGNLRWRYLVLMLILITHFIFDLGFIKAGYLVLRLWGFKVNLWVVFFGDFAGLL